MVMCYKFLSSIRERICLLLNNKVNNRRINVVNKIRRIAKSGWGNIFCFLSFSLILLKLVFCLEKNMEFRIWVYDFLEQLIKEKGIRIFKTWRDTLNVVGEDVLNEMEGILGGIVAFFYSVQDSRKDGIPYRTILAYGFGSYTVPVLFFYTWILFLGATYARISSLQTLESMFVFQILVFQALIIIFILLSTAYKYSIHVIGNAEIRQFRILTKDANRRKKQKSRISEKAENNPLYVWTHLLHHLEQVVLSDELISDKMILIRRIIGTPYYKGPTTLFTKAFGRMRNIGSKQNKYKIKLYKKRFRSNNLEKVYEFYFENVLTIFEFLDGNEEKQLLNGIFLVLYEFMEELTQKYREIKINEKKDKRKEKIRKCYLITLSGIMNGVMVSNTENAEMFCHYILNNIMTEGEERKLQLHLYFLFQEYLYRIKKEAIKIDNLAHIDGLEEWTVIKNRKLYEEFWIIWMKFTSINTEYGYQYLLGAMNTLLDTGVDSSTIMYIKSTIKRIQEESVYGHQSDRIIK